MSLFSHLFSVNVLLDDATIARVRVGMKRWGIAAAALVVVGLGVLALQEASPESGKWFDLVEKAFFSICRGALAVAGALSGAWVGYVVYQAVESSEGGAFCTKIEIGDDPTIEAAKLQNRGLMLALYVASGALVIGLALGK